MEKCCTYTCKLQGNGAQKRVAVDVGVDVTPPKQPRKVLSSGRVLGANVPAKSQAQHAANKASVKARLTLNKIIQKPGLQKPLQQQSPVKTAPAPATDTSTDIADGVSFPLLFSQ